MNQASYCCNTGTTCEWDDTGHVACCASGYTCQGSPYSPGASEGQYQPQAETQTTTVYQTPPAQSSVIGNVVPIVPVTEATVLTPAPAPEPTYKTTTVYQELSSTTTVVPVPYSTTTVYNVPRSTTTVYNAAAAPVPVTTTYAPSPLTTTVTQQAQEVVTDAKCAGGYTTLTDQGVGVPVTTVGCNIIFNSGGRRARGEWVEMFVLEVLGFLGMALWWR